jgi:ABC-type transporter MlaC component
MSSTVTARRLLLRFTASFLVLTAVSANGETTKRAEQADAFLTETHRLISQIRLNDQSSADSKRALIDRLLDEKLDLATMARLALGKREEAFSRSELSEFIQEYSRFLVYTYLREIAWSDPKDTPRLEGTSVDPDTGWVRIATKAKPRSSIANQRGEYRQSSVFRAEYLLRERHGNWRIVQISFNGVDLNRSFGSQFEAVLKKSTPEELLKELHDLNNRRGDTNPLQ